MISGATKLATFPLRRRLIGALVMAGGVAVVALGFFLSLTNDVVPAQSSTLHLAVSSATAAGILQHAFDHPVLSNTVHELGDIAVRGAVVVMAGAAALALISILITPLRGFAGLAAGLGLMGTAAISGVLFGENTRITADFSHNPQIHVDLGIALWVFAVGFAAILVGGALAAWRPLAGLFTGIGLAVTGAGLGAALALVLGGNHLVTAVLGGR